MNAETMQSGTSSSLAPKPLMLGLLVGLTLLVGSLAASSADAGVAVRSFETTPSTTQAGGHPDVTVAFSNEISLDPVTGDPCYCNNLRDAKVSLPAGVIGNPHATPRCSTMEFAQDICPVDSQVGVAIADVALFGCSPCFRMKVPLYNLMPLPNQAALLGFKAFLFSYPTYTVLSARTDGDYGLDAQVAAINQTFALAGYKQVLWGVPAAKVNDGERFKSGGAFPVDPPAASNSPEIPFLQNPTTCSGPLQSDLELIAYDHGVSNASAPWPATTGCDQLSFNPSLAAQPSTPQTDTASGLDVDLDVPQVLSPSTPSASQIRSATITLPEGFSINPNAADGKTSCSDAEARIGTTEEARCPEHAKVGNLSLTSSALPGPIPGNIYLGEPRPGNRYRLILAADGYATHVKLTGSIKADPQTGQLVASFVDLPQTPFSEFQMHFFGSERGLLATPDAVRHLPGENHLRSMELGAARPGFDPVLQPHLGPRRQSLPGPAAAVRAGLQSGFEERRLGAAQPLLAGGDAPRRRSDLRPAEAERSPRLLGDAQRRRLLSRCDAGGDRCLGVGRGRARLTRMLGGQPDRQRDGGCRRRHPPGLLPGLGPPRRSI